MQVRDLVRVLSVKLRQFADPLGPQCVVSCVYGLQLFRPNSMNAEIAEFISLITDMILDLGSMGMGLEQDGSSGRMTAQGVAMTMQGLRKMGSDSPESRRLINALLPYIEPDILLEGEGLSGFEVGIALSGLKHMDVEHSEVRELITSLIALLYLPSHNNELRYKIPDHELMEYDGIHDRWLLSPAEFGYALSGMCRLSNQDPLVSELFLATVARLDSARLNEPTPQSVALAVHGMQNFRIPTRLLNIFEQQIKLFEERGETLSAQGVGMLLYGLSKSLSTGKSFFTNLILQ